MSQRRLSKQQHRQIVKSKEIELSVTHDLRDGLVIAHFGKKILIKALANSQHVECKVRQNLGAIVCGDIVYWKEAQDCGIILGVKERHSILGRTNKSGIMKPLAANVDQVFIICAPKPEISTYLIDSYLVACETLGLKAIIVLNKCDLLNDNESIPESLAYYASLGYPCLTVSAKNKTDLSKLEHQLEQRINVLVGQSGVGKSTLINTLIPEANVETQHLSQDLGTHTTTTSVLHELDRGGAIIDSPGVREFGLGHLNQADIFSGFIDFIPHKGQCKFRNCTHSNEPDCRLLLAVKQGNIADYRIANYHKITKQFGLHT